MVGFSFGGGGSLQCKNCGDQIGDDNSSSNEFCSEQREVEYQLEHK